MLWIFSAETTLGSTELISPVLPPASPGAPAARDKYLRLNAKAAAIKPTAHKDANIPTTAPTAIIDDL